MENNTESNISPLIMIVDDNPQNLHLLGSMLGNSSEFDLSFATSGDEALEIICDQTPDLILLDVNMPGKNGFETCICLRQNEATRDVPVIFLTAQGEAEYVVKGFKCGGNDYVVKPFEPQELLARVRVQLELLNSRRELKRLNSELLKVNEELRSLSNTDGLLKIANRRYFDEMLLKEWHRAMRGNHCLSLLILDVDYFKRYNDHYGHLQGDECLKKVAEIISSNLHRATDMVARYGGEEFAVILSETTPEGALHLAEIIREAIQRSAIPHQGSDVGPCLTISIGAAGLIPQIDMIPDCLMNSADKALYLAKTEGRNCSRVGNVESC